VSLEATVLGACAARLAAVLLAFVSAAGPAWGAPAGAPAVAGVPVDFLLFGATLAGIALFHRRTLQIAVGGLLTITAYELAFAGFREGTGGRGLLAHLEHEWVILANLFCLLMGFALLSRHFEKSHVPLELPRLLPDDWKGGFLLLVMIFVLSSFLDNIAAALIGGAMAHQLFKAKVHIGYLAAIVAASNAGGSGSVVGDTTTTMMWIDGVNPLQVLEAYVAAGVALAIFGIPAAMQQHKHSPILKHTHEYVRVDWARVFIVALILVAAIVTNITMNLEFPDLLEHFPFIGIAVWVAILVTVPLRRPDWEVLPDTFRGTIFLLSLVTAASMMPVEKLPDASWRVTMGLGFVSAVFDNIPLTALALKQGGYDWGFVAYAVGFGGSMIWFGSSAGVALSNMYPEAKNAVAWVRGGWHVAVAYVVGFFVMLAAQGWYPQPKHEAPGSPPQAERSLPAAARSSG
jgi:hypothetical protein